MIIRDAFARDGAEIGSLVDSLWADDKLWRPSRAGSYAVDGPATVVAAQVGVSVAGVASLLPSKRSRFGLLHMDVAVPHQRRGVGTALLSKLRSLHPGIRMMVRVRPWDEKTSSFVEHRGFSIAERVVEGWIEPTSPAMSRWIEGALASIPDSVKVEGFATAQHSSRDIAAVIDSWYQRHHQWAPPRNVTIDEAVAIYLDPALPNTGHIAEIGDELVGAGVLLPDPFQLRPDGAHLAYLGVSDGGRPDEPAIVRGLFAACLKAAKRQGRSVQIEVSDIHAPAWELVKSLPAPDVYEGLIVYVG